MAELELVGYFDGKKFMWDGTPYDTKAAAEEVAAKYREDDFETEIVEEDGVFGVYTRRVVTEIVVEGPPP
jgi:hypothetical protein